MLQIELSARRWIKRYQLLRHIMGDALVVGFIVRRHKIAVWCGGTTGQHE